MKTFLSAILLLLLAGVAGGALPDPHDAQVAAAVGDAVSRLDADIEAMTLGSTLSVADFLQQTESRSRLLQTLQSADQIGGPRWIDNDTCQVKLAIRSDPVCQTLLQIAQESGRRSPLPPEALSAKLRAWDHRTFTATGTSISAARAELLRPADLPGPWRNVADDVRRQTIVQARDNAVDRVLASIAAIEIADQKTVAAALSDQAVKDAMRQWLVSRPVTRLEFKSDRSIEITLAATGRDVYESLSQSISNSNVLPKDSLKLAKIRQEFEQVTAPAVGVARIATSGQSVSTGNPPTQLKASIPRQPPAWLAQTLNTEATEKFKGSRLKTARAAENSARDLLRKKVDVLQISTTPISDAVKRDPAVARAVEQAMDRSRAYKIEYLPDGSATVKVSLDPRDLWDQLRELP